MKKYLLLLLLLLSLSASLMLSGCHNHSRKGDITVKDHTVPVKVLDKKSTLLLKEFCGQLKNINSLEVFIKRVNVDDNGKRSRPETSYGVDNAYELQYFCKDKKAINDNTVPNHIYIGKNKFDPMAPQMSTDYYIDVNVSPSAGQQEIIKASLEGPNGYEVSTYLNYSGWIRISKVVNGKIKTAYKVNLQDGKIKSITAIYPRADHVIPGTSKESTGYKYTIYTFTYIETNPLTGEPLPNPYYLLTKKAFNNRNSDLDQHQGVIGATCWSNPVYFKQGFDVCNSVEATFFPGFTMLLAKKAMVRRCKEAHALDVSGGICYARCQANTFCIYGDNR